MIALTRTMGVVLVVVMDPGRFAVGPEEGTFDGIPEGTIDLLGVREGLVLGRALLLGEELGALDGTVLLLGLRDGATLGRPLLLGM